jgi:hypothetical protein
LASWNWQTSERNSGLLPKEEKDVEENGFDLSKEIDKVEEELWIEASALNNSNQYAKALS